MFDFGERDFATLTRKRVFFFYVVTLIEHFQNVHSRKELLLFSKKSGTSVYFFFG